VSDARRTYQISQIEINDTKVVQVVIDPHYELKHSMGITDALVLDLVKELDGRREVPEAKAGR
jgi:hypothetical protein